ncbi:MAG: ABC transporter ATP-binding protein, partial [Halarsenatibacteraceae bacterium]
MTLIRLVKASKIYQQGKIEVPALKEVDLEFETGEFSTVFGPSGSGKTTLLNIIGALDKPTSGTVHFNGENIVESDKNQLAMLRRNHIGFIFQSYNLIPVLTAYE